MKLQEAIHNLQLHLDGNPNLHDTKLRQSMHLGIEALQFRLRWEQQEGELEFPLLLGQTLE